ncbi:DUF2190 family protein [Horticoccus luteus]|uniref:DUF2190 family protein n=1 Tax=Horticoccus luteus TaxID=2862869 RepID=A0A8F9TWA5_9BACT|nr:capsid cement protein [Horticoccus luteus]QYM80281.1 DUF2190 family protein [Horticoccus luteus]
MHTLLLIMSVLVAIALLVSWIASRPRGAQFTPLANDVAAGIHDDLQITLEAAVATRHLLLKAGAAARAALIGTVADRPIGFAEDEGAIGDKIAFYPLGFGRRTVLGRSAAAIVSGAQLTSAANGKVITTPGAAGTYWVVGTAWGDAAGADEDIEIIPCTPFQVVVS